MVEFNEEFDKQVMSPEAEGTTGVNEAPVQEETHVVAEESAPSAPEEAPEKGEAEESQKPNGYMKRIHKLTRRNKDKDELIAKKNQYIQELQERLEKQVDQTPNLQKEDFGGNDEEWNNYKIQKGINEGIADVEKRFTSDQISRERQEIERLQNEINAEQAQAWNQKLEEKANSDAEFKNRVAQASNAGLNWKRLQPHLQNIPNGVDVADYIASDFHTMSLIENTPDSQLAGILSYVGMQAPRQQQQVQQQKQPIPPAPAKKKPIQAPKEGTKDFYRALEKEMYGR